MKKFLSLVFATMLVGQVSAVYNYDFVFECDDGQVLYYQITSNNEPYTVEVTYPRRQYSNYYYNYGKPTGNLTIPETVTLDDITYLVTGVSDYAFYGCSGLTSITIPQSVSTIGSKAFYDCSSFNSIVIACDADFSNAELCFIKDDYKYMVLNKTMVKIVANAYSGDIVIPENVIAGNEFIVTSIGDRAFFECSGLTSISIPDGVISIGADAFYNCTSLTSLSIPNTIKSIECCNRNTADGNQSAFYGCVNLDYKVYDNGFYIGNNENPYLVLVKAKKQSVASCTIHENCKIINADAFYNCNELTEISIPDSICYIGYGAFLRCNGLQKTEFTSIENLCKIKFDTFGRPHSDNLYINGEIINNLIIPNSITSIGDYTFSGCNKLTSVILHDSISNIGRSAFGGCSGLTSIKIPNSVITIGDQAFEYCTGLTTITIPESVISIGNSAFYESNLTSITIPESVTSIGGSAFRYCKHLKTVVLKSAARIDYNVFEYCDSIETLFYNNSEIKNTYITKLKTFIIGDSAKTINCGTMSIGKVVCMASVPPAFENDPFSEIDTIYVPAKSVDTYKSAAIWKYKEIMPFGIVKAISADNTKGTVLGDSLLLIDKTLTFRAISTNDYHFVKWSDGNTDNPRSYSVASDTSFSAIFEAHTVVTDTAVPATCTTTGLTEGSHCSVCGKVLVSQTETPMIEHIVVTDTAIAATCTATGLTEGSHCSVCGTTIIAQTETPMAAHTVVTDAAVPATATTDGLTEGSHCSVCGKVIVAQTIIPALGEQGSNENQVGNNEGGNENQGGNENNPATAVAESAANAINIYATGNTIVVENATDEIRVYNAMGALVGRDAINRVRTEIHVNGTGVYIVKTGGVVKRVMVN